VNAMMDLHWRKTAFPVSMSMNVTLKMADVHKLVKIMQALSSVNVTKDSHWRKISCYVMISMNVKKIMAAVHIFV
jgi:hypothetical protein